MNQITVDNVAMRDAMRDAGIKIPTNQRLVWDWLKERPGQPCKAIQAGIKINGNSISAQLSQMVSRGMLSAKLEKSMPLNRNVFHYSTVGKEFKVMPAIEKRKDMHTRAIEDKKLEVFTPVAVVATVETIAPLTIKQEAEVILSRTSILLARELYTQLYQIFSSQSRVT